MRLTGLCVVKSFSIGRNLEVDNGKLYCKAQVVREVVLFELLYWSRENAPVQGREYYKALQHDLQ